MTVTYTPLWFAFIAALLAMAAGFGYWLMAVLFGRDGE